MRPLIPTLLTLVCCSGSLLAGPGPAAPGSPVGDIRREAALASREVYYNLRELPGSTQLYRVLYSIHGYSSGIQVPCQRDYLILDEMVHDAEFILERMQVPAFDPHCPYQRRCAPVKPLPCLDQVSGHVFRLRELVDVMLLPPGVPGTGSEQHSEQPPEKHVPEKHIPQDKVPEKYVPQEVPGKQIPQEPLPEKYVPQEVPGGQNPPVIPQEVPKQYEEQPEGPGVVIPGNPYRELEETPLNTVPQPNPTDVLITPGQPFDVSASYPNRENARPNTNPDLNRDEYLPEVLSVIPQETAPGPVLVSP